MVRVSKNLMFVVAALLCTALAGCSSSGNDSGSGGSGSTEVASEGLHIVFSPMYSAFDGVHMYQVPATIDQAALDMAGVDPVKPETISWSVDDKFVSKEAFPDIPGGVLLTTKSSGTTTVTAMATTASGRKIKGSSTLEITKATDEEWQAGQARYDNMVAINFMNLGMMGATGAAGTGAMAAPANPMAFLQSIPKDASCGNCHNNTTGLTVEHTPLQTAGYSDDDLIKIFTTGAKPMGAKFNSPFLKNLPIEFATMIYVALHQWNVSTEVQRGIVFKLRSITPKVQPDIDLTRLRMMFMNMNPGAAPGTGAAGDAAPAAGAAAPAASGAAGS